MDVSELKVNDRVGFSRSHCDTFMEKGFGVVIKINGHGHIYVTPESGKETKVFDKYGYERKKKPGISTAIYRKQAMKQRGRYGCHLCSAEELEQSLTKQEADNVKQRAVRELLDYLSGRRCGNGRYEIQEENKKEIKRLVEAL